MARVEFHVSDVDRPHMESDGMFTLGEYEAARLYVACLAKHARNENFRAGDIGFEFGPISEMQAGISDKETTVTTKDFIRAALKLMLGQMKNISELTELPVEALVSRLGVAVASEDPGDVPKDSQNGNSSPPILDNPPDP